MKKHTLVLLVAAGLFLAAGCSVIQDPIGPSLSGSLHPLAITNFAFNFTLTNRPPTDLGLLGGFAGVGYSAADTSPTGDGGTQNLDGEHLYIWATNAKRSRGGGWFWGGWVNTSVPTNMFINPINGAAPNENQEWTMIIKVRSTNDGAKFQSRVMNFQFIATNDHLKKKGVLKYLSPMAVPIQDTEYVLNSGDFTYSGNMSGPAEALKNVDQMGFYLDNAQIGDLDSFGFIVDYIVIGFK